MKISSKNAGFTLIETLVVILLVGILGVAASQSLFSLLQGATKTEIVKEIKQNGDYAMSVMEVKIRNSTIADSNCTGAAATSLTITNPDATTTAFNCFAHDGVNKIRTTTTASNYLTNSGVTVPDCSSANISFTCTNTSGVKTVQIKYTLGPKNTTSCSTATSGCETFQTQVTLRNK